MASGDRRDSASAGADGSPTVGAALDELRAAATAEPASMGEAFIATDAVSAQLGRRTARSGTIMLIGNAAQFACNVGGTMILARLLTPGDFGLMAMAGSILAFVNTFKDMGVSTAAVQRQDLSHDLASAVFWLNLRNAVLLSLGVAAGAPLVAWFYGESRLLAMTLALSVAVFATAAAVMHLGLMRRQMRYWPLVQVDLGATVLSVLAAVLAAVGGAGYWALVLQYLTLHVAQAVGTMLACGWRPLPPGRGRPRTDPAFRSILDYTRFSGLARFIGYFHRNTDAILIGRLTNPAWLGLYSKAFDWALMPLWQLYMPISSVAVSSLSRLQDDPGRYRHYFRHAVGALLMAVFPLMAFLFVEAHDGLLLLLGEQWLEAVPLFRVLTVGAVFVAATQPMKWVYLAEGRSRAWSAWTAVSASVTIAGVAIGAVLDGVRGVAWGFAVASAVLVAPAAWAATRGSHLKARHVWQAAWRPAVGASAAGALIWWAQPQLQLIDSLLLRLLASFAVFAVVYVPSVVILPGGRDLVRNLLAVLRQR